MVSPRKSHYFIQADDHRSATRSDFHIAAARNAVFEYFDAPASDYVCIFTANATTALKLVGESFPFRAGSSLIIPADCHNSVNGIRRFAEDAGAKVGYLETTQYGGFREGDAMVGSSHSLLLCTPALYLYDTAESDEGT
jgi:selenocysteine lyase/cysteine desulfurase